MDEYTASPTQDEQVECFQAVRHLTSGGTFVLEAFVPDVCRFDLMARTAGMRP